MYYIYVSSVTTVYPPAFLVTVKLTTAESKCIVD